MPSSWDIKVSRWEDRDTGRVSWGAYSMRGHGAYMSVWESNKDVETLYGPYHVTSEEASTLAQAKAVAIRRALAERASAPAGAEGGEAGQ